MVWVNTEKSIENKGLTKINDQEVFSLKWLPFLVNNLVLFNGVQHVKNV